MGNRLIGLAAGTAAAVLLVGGIGTAAYAADVRSTVEVALASLGVEASDELVDDLAEEELLDEALDEDAAAGDESGEPGGDEGGDEGDSAEEELEESFLAWNERAELWRTAFAEVKTEFDACRAEVDAAGAESGETAPGAKGDCAVAFSGRLQVAFAETLVEFLQSQEAAIAALPEDERAAAQAELDRRLEKALTKLDRTTERVEARDEKRLERAIEKLSGADDFATEDSATGDAEAEADTKNGKPEKPAGSNGNGKGGGGGKPDHAGKPAGD
jgi:hypothetical protein